MALGDDSLSSLGFQGSRPARSWLAPPYQGSSESHVRAPGNASHVVFVELHSADPSGTGLRREDIQREASKWKQKVLFRPAPWGYVESPVDAGEGQPWLLGASLRPGFGACRHEYHTL